MDQFGQSSALLPAQETICIGGLLRRVALPATNDGISGLSNLPLAVVIIEKMTLNAIVTITNGADTADGIEGFVACSAALLYWLSVQETQFGDSQRHKRMVSGKTSTKYSKIIKLIFI